MPTLENTGVSGGTFTVTVNRIIKPYLKVEPRKYRLRIINGGPSRFYQLYLRVDSAKRTQTPPFFVVATDGNLLPEPIEADDLRLAVAQRHDVVVDFSHFEPGDFVYLVNRLQMRDDGAGPTGRLLDEGDPILRFEVIRARGSDPSRIPDHLRALPSIDLSEVRRERVWDFDYDNGLWTINGKLFDPDRTDARVEEGSAEIWTFRNAGNAWSHPTHIHFEEFQILERDFQPLEVGDVQRSRKDDMWIGPNDVFKIFIRFRDFYGAGRGSDPRLCHHDRQAAARRRQVRPVVYRGAIPGDSSGGTAMNPSVRARLRQIEAALAHAEQQRAQQTVQLPADAAERRRRYVEMTSPPCARPAALRGLTPTEMVGRFRRLIAEGETRWR